MARPRTDDEEEGNEEELDLEERDQLIRYLKSTKPMFFAYVPKGAMGKLIVRINKSERNTAATAAKKDIGGGSPWFGTCLGPLSAKIFKFDKQPDVDKMGASIRRVVKKDTSLNVVPDIQLTNGPAGGEEEE